MALTGCRSCDAPISDGTRTCPHCGTTSPVMYKGREGVSAPGRMRLLVLLGTAGVSFVVLLVTRVAEAAVA